ncbi:hypothetical protein C2W62_48395, partial [Candidatus Entotheonella serta]
MLDLASCRAWHIRIGDEPNGTRAFKTGKLLISSAPARQDTKLAILNYFRNGEISALSGSPQQGWVTPLPPPIQS